MNIGPFKNKSQIYDEIIKTLEEPSWKDSGITESKLNELINKNSSLITSQGDGQKFPEVLNNLSERIKEEFNTDEGKNLVSMINGIVTIFFPKSEKMESHAEKTERLGVETEAVSLKNYGCKTAKEAVQYVIDNKLTSANLEGFPKLTDVDLENLINNCPNLTNLSIKSKKITDEGLRPITALTKLNVLSLRECFEITNKSLEHISKLANLIELDLSMTAVTNEGIGLKHITALTKLKVLNFAGCLIQNEGLEHISKLKDLEDLNLSGSAAITGIGLENLGALKNLKKLNLSGCEIKDEDLKHLKVLKKEFKALEELNLSKNWITDKGLKHLKVLKKEFKALKKLNLSKNRITDESGRRLDKFLSKRMGVHAEEAKRRGVETEAVSLKNYGCKTAKEAVKYVIDNKLTSANLEDFPDLTDVDLNKLIKNCPNLTNLSIKSKKITDEGLRPITALTKLNVLSLRECFEITNKSLEHISKLANLIELDLSMTAIINEGIGLTHITALTKLKVLNFAECLIQNEGLEHISKLTNLEDLNLSGSAAITGIGLEDLGALKNLKKLNLSKCEIKDEGLKHIKMLIKEFKALEELNLSENGITDKGLKHLKVFKKECKALKKLNLSKNRWITDKGGRRLMRSLPRLTIETK